MYIGLYLYLCPVRPIYYIYCTLLSITFKVFSLSLRLINENMSNDDVIETDISKILKNDDKDEVKKWLKFAVDTKVPPQRFSSLLRQAVISRSNAVITELLQSGKIDPGTVREVLEFACRSGQLDAIIIIIDHLTNIKDADFKIDNFITTSSSYGQLMVVELILKHFSIDAKNVISQQWLFLTHCALDDIIYVKQWVNKEGIKKCLMRAFIVACYNGSKRVATFLKDKLPRPIDWNFKYELRKQYWDHTALTAMIARGHQSLVELVFKEDCIPLPFINESRGRLKQTALHLAIWCGTEDISELHTACGTGNIEAVKRLCSNISNLSRISEEFLFNQQDNRGDTPLHCACRFGCMETVKVLLAYFPKLEIVNEWYHSPLQLALQNGNDQIAKFLSKTFFIIINTNTPDKVKN